MGKVMISSLLLASVRGGEPCFSYDPKTMSMCSECSSRAGAAVTEGWPQCVDNGSYLTCYGTLDECCEDGSLTVSADECLANSGGASSVPEDLCQNVVTLDTSKTNKDCRTLCDKLIGNGDPREVEEFAKMCKYESYSIKDDHVRLGNDSCFSSWVYGYSEANAGDDTDDSYYKRIIDIQTPSDCQQACQDDGERCVGWLWTAPDATGATTEDPGNGCRLKDSKLITGALNTKYTKSDYSDAVDPKVCNVGLGYMCKTGGYECMNCDNTPRCVWKSSRHVSGWRYCHEPEQFCEVPPINDLTTAEPTTTTTTTAEPTTTTTTAEPTTTTTTAEPTTTTTTAEPTTTTTTAEPTTSTTTAEPTTTTTTTAEPTTSTTTTAEPTTTTTTTAEPTTTTESTTTTTTTTTLSTSTTEPAPATTTTTEPATTSTAPHWTKEKGQGLVWPHNLEL